MLKFFLVIGEKGETDTVEIPGCLKSLTLRFDFLLLDCFAPFLGVYCPKNITHATNLFDSQLFSNESGKEFLYFV